MTIGIGVLASESAQTDTMILLADTKGSFGTAYSMSRFNKLFMSPANNFYAVAADKMDNAGELFDLCCKYMLLLPDQGTYQNKQDAIHNGSDAYKRARFRRDVLPRHAHRVMSLPEDFDESHLTPSLLKAWRKFNFGCEMIVGTTDDAGQAYLFCVSGYGEVLNFSLPGFCAIGTGATNAMFWLTFRQQRFALNVKHSAYHAFEAKIMAESSPYVDQRIDLLIAQKGRHFHVSKTKDLPQDAPVTIEELRRMFAEYGPKETMGLTP